MMRWNLEKAIKYISENNQCTLLSNEFINVNGKLLIECNCGETFETSLNNFRKGKQSCSKCKKQSRNCKVKRHVDLQYIINYVKANSDCELLSDKYVNSTTKLKFKCSCGNLFEKTFNGFENNNKNCKKCSYNKISENQYFDYTYVNTYIKNKDCKLLTTNYEGCFQELDILCNCGEIYRTSFTYFKNSNQIRCRKCTNQMSKGEIMIERYLKSKNINYVTQFKFDDLKADNDMHFLKFDFAIFEKEELKLLIEFDGKQHYQAVEFYGGIKSFNKLKHNDHCKNKYCYDNNISLLRIKYDEIVNIEKILNSKFNYDDTVSSLSKGRCND